jgi:hypothetical protein
LPGACEKTHIAAGKVKAGKTTSRENARRGARRNLPPKPAGTALTEWLRLLETYRNLCISPSPEFLRTLAWMRDIQAILKPRQTSNV